jgi:predicted nuclease of predicted toxin-antitoxin system
MEDGNPAMRLKLDEKISHHLKPVLAGLGHDDLTAADENLLSSPDTEIARAAKDEQRMLLTLDVEFADLRKYPPGSHPGVILFRPLSLSPLSVNDFITDFVHCTDLEKLAACLAVVDTVHVRVRYPLKAAD